MKDRCAKGPATVAAARHMPPGGRGRGAVPARPAAVAGRCAGVWAVGCDSAAQAMAAARASVTQGKPGAWARGWRRGVLTLCLGLPLAAAAGCPGPVVRFEPLAPGVWWVPAATGESDAVNRGQVSNLVLARDGRRLWALGSGPSPAFGRALACQARQRLGGPVTDVVSPWARPELVLGAGALVRAGGGTRAVRHWAHASVADAMAEQCPHCVDRLRQRLQAAAADLGDAPISLPRLRLQGEQGRLGPWSWWRLPRAEGRWVTLWRLHGRPLWVAPGLLDGAGPPDGRDADLALLQQSAERLAKLAGADGPAARFLGEQGPPMGAEAPARHAAYWQALLAAAEAAVERGDDESAPAPALDGFPATWAAHPWHGFNWQRAWRQVEPRVLAAPKR